VVGQSHVLAILEMKGRTTEAPSFVIPTKSTPLGLKFLYALSR
jgi:hypothetical protein